MAVDVLTQILIERPLETVADYVAQPDNAPSWYVNIKSVEWKTPSPLQVGSRFEFTARFLGRQLTYTYEVVELKPRGSMVMRTSEGPFPMETSYTWRPEGPGATWMRLRNRGNPAGFSRLVAPFMALAMRRANRKDLRRLKELLESAAPDDLQSSE